MPETPNPAHIMEQNCGFQQYVHTGEQARLNLCSILAIDHKSKMRPLIAGNWKMNGLDSALPEIEAVAETAAADAPDAEILICPPATLLSRAAQVAAGRIKIGGQD